MNITRAAVLGWVFVAMMGMAEATDKPTVQWISSSDGVEEYERLVQESDGKILIELMHAKETQNPWGIYKNGAGYGRYATKEQARAAAEKMLGR